MANTAKQFGEAFLEAGETFRWADFLQEEALGNLSEGYEPEFDEYLRQELAQLMGRNNYSFQDLRIVLQIMEGDLGG